MDVKSVFLFEKQVAEADLAQLQDPRWSFQPLTIITKCSMLDAATVLDPLG